MCRLRTRSVRSTLSARSRQARYPRQRLLRLLHRGDSPQAQTGRHSIAGSARARNDGAKNSESPGRATLHCLKQTTPRTARSRQRERIKNSEVAERRRWVAWDANPRSHGQNTKSESPAGRHDCRPIRCSRSRQSSVRIPLLTERIDPSAIVLAPPCQIRLKEAEKHYAEWKKRQASEGEQ